MCERERERWKESTKSRHHAGESFAFYKSIVLAFDYTYEYKLTPLITEFVGFQEMVGDITALENISLYDATLLFATDAQLFFD